MTPRSYSRLESDEELLARLRADFSGDSLGPYETLDQFAERMKSQRRLVWCDG